MRSRWKEWLRRWVGSAVPVDGDPGRWAPRSRRQSGRPVRPGRLETTGRGGNESLPIELRPPVGRELQLPPPAA